MRRALYVKGCVLFVGAIVAFAAFLRLAAGPISLEDYATDVGTALAERIGPGWTVRLGDTTLELYGAHPAVRTTALEIRNPAGIAVVRAPQAIVSLDPISLVTGTISPRQLELQGLQLRATMAKDGSLVFAAQADPVQVSRPVRPPVVASGTEPAAARNSVVAAAVASLLDPVVGATGVIAALDRAAIRDASLTLIGSDGRERAAFARVSAAFERQDGGERTIELDLDGPNGPWHIDGRVKGGPDRAAEIDAEGVPLADLLLLTGLSSLPGTSDLTLSGRVATAFTADRLTRLEGRLAVSPGTIRRAAGPPIRIDGAKLEAVWDEASGTLRLPAVEVLSEGTNVRLAGELTGAPDKPWRLTLSGQDVVVAAVTPDERPFRVDTLAAAISFDEAGIALERGSVKGEQLDMEFVAGLVPTATGPTMTGTLEVRNSNARRLIRLWPDSLNPKLRKYLAERMGPGTVERLRIRSVLDQKDFVNAFTDDPMTDGAMDLRFSTSGTELAATNGVPPLRDLKIEGRITGITASVKARDGYIEMPDGRRIGFTDASFVNLTLDKPGSPSQVGFHLFGGADALASFLKSPLFAEAGTADIDPATVHGQVDLRVKLPLPPADRPPLLSEMMLSLSGTLSDVAVDRLPGKERLEAGNFTILGEAGSLGLKGEARIGGTPASIELSSPRPGSGELSVSTVLDDAARAKRSLPAPPLLAGPVGVKASLPLGQPHAVARVEVDLGKASVDGLMPGWVKPSGKPGRITFGLADGEAVELRDFTVDAGPVQMKGQLTVVPGSGVERADLPVFKLSPGDDLKVQLERAQSGAYRVTLRGNNGDARPLLRWASAAGQAKGGREGGRDGGGARDRDKGPEEVELDAALNILTGYNDEALTGFSAKLSAKGADIRSLQLSGRFRGAALDAQIAKRDSGSPIMTVRSGDAGATLRFLDLYRRMVGGVLTVDGRTAEGVQQGRIGIEDFGLKNEPALASIVSQAGQSQASFDERFAPIARADLDQVPFKRLWADFHRAGQRTEYTQAGVFGSQVGFNASGYVDGGRDRLDITGTFVPAYLINNAFSQLPVVGLLLGGGSNEGLIAVEFRAAGSVANPTLTVNPLTVVAPGILRKLFGWVLLDGAAPPAEASVAAPERRAGGSRRTDR